MSSNAFTYQIHADFTLEVTAPDRESADRTARQAQEHPERFKLAGISSGDGHALSGLDHLEEGTQWRMGKCVGGYRYHLRGGLLITVEAEAEEEAEQAVQNAHNELVAGVLDGPSGCRLMELEIDTDAYDLHSVNGKPIA
ncbi:hypothetical protein [Streptomyces xiamenensis]|uniref:hypothetical protein n=1 Tax=Streptomyces xiamenensis TaxID=408015 RepID=UPI0035DA61BC